MISAPAYKTATKPASNRSFPTLRLRHYVMIAVALVYCAAQLWEAFGPVAAVPASVRMALGASAMATMMTALGALSILLTRNISVKIQDTLLGFGGGIMLAASVFSLIMPAIDHAQVLGYNQQASVMLTVTGVMVGALFVLILNHIVPHEHFISQDQPAQSRATASRLWMFVMAVTIHNFPEGLAIGVGFGHDELGKPMALATGIGVQNIPEGLVVALALVKLGYSPLKAAGAGVLSGLVEPVGAVLGALATDMSVTALPWALAGAGGAMLFVISHEVIPESHRQGHETQATLGLMTGFVTMLMLDVLIS